MTSAVIESSHVAKTWICLKARRILSHRRARLLLTSRVTVTGGGGVLYVDSDYRYACDRVHACPP